MNTFRLVLQDATHSERFDGLSSFVGEDASGSFGIQANHDRLMAVLVFGLARFRIGEEPWQYLALPGAVLSFQDNTLTLNTRRFLRDSDYLRISAALQQQLLAEEENLRSVKESLHRMEEEILRRMWEMSRKGG
jgi:F-type H+-transporting ATPase subunit epsilon